MRTKDEKERERLVGELVLLYNLDYDAAQKLIDNYPNLAEKILDEHAPLSEKEEKIIEKLEEETQERTRLNNAKKRLGSLLTKEGIDKRVIPYIVEGRPVPYKRGNKLWNISADLTNKIMFTDEKGRSIHKILEEEPNKVKTKAKLLKYASKIAKIMQTGAHKDWKKEYIMKNSIKGAGAMYLLEGKNSQGGKPLNQIFESIIKRAANNPDAFVAERNIEIKGIKKAHEIAKSKKAKERKEKKKKKRIKQKRLPI